MADLVVVMGRGGSGRRRRRSRSTAGPPTPSSPISSARPTCCDMTPTAAGRRRVRGAAIRRRCTCRPDGDKAVVSIRPEDVHLVPPAERRRSPAIVTFVRDLGGTIETFVDVGGTPDRRGVDAARAARLSGRPAGRHRSCRRKAAVVLDSHETRSRPERLPITRRSSFPAAMLIVFFVVPFGIDDRGQLLPAPAGRLLHARLRVRQLCPVPLAPSSATCSASRCCWRSCVAVGCVVLGLPFTYLLTRLPRRAQIVWLVALLSVLSLSEVIIGFAWSTLFSRTAGITNLLVALGLMEQP